MFQCPSLFFQSIIRTIFTIFGLISFLTFVLGQLTVSENGRFLAQPDGTPFLWLGDTGWGLFKS